MSYDRRGTPRHVDISPVDHSKRLNWYYGVARQISQQADKFLEEGDLDRVGLHAETERGMGRGGVAAREEAWLVRYGPVRPCGMLHCIAPKQWGTSTIYQLNKLLQLLLMLFLQAYIFYRRFCHLAVERIPNHNRCDDSAAASQVVMCAKPFSIEAAPR